MTLRPATVGDEAFLRRLFLESRPELQALPPELVDLQIAAQRAQYVGNHPRALDEIVEAGSVPVGRCWTAEADGELHLLDLAVPAEHRRHGFGRAALDTVLNRAAERSLPVRLTVWSTNADAVRLYRAAGFTEAGRFGGRTLLRRLPGMPR